MTREGEGSPPTRETRLGGEQDTELLAAQAVTAMVDELRALGLTEEQIDAAVEEHR